MNIGIVGSGMIVNVILDTWAAFDDIAAKAIWCREQDQETARKIADAHGIPRVYTSYEEFLADDSFDFCYIGLINSLHYEYSLRALEAGKSVVCEKPFTSTRAQAEGLLSVAREKGVFVFESILPWYQENYEEIRRRLPELGDIRLVQASFSQYSRRYEAYKQGTVLPVFNPRLDGGALYDMGTYSVHWVMGLFGVPRDVVYLPNLGYNGIDVSGVLVLDYGSFKAVCMTAKDSSSPNRCVIQGDGGYLVQPTEPARCEDITLTRNGCDPELVDVEPLGEGFSCIWRSITKAVAADDREASYKLLERVIEVMGVMETARKKAGITFSCD